MGDVARVLDSVREVVVAMARLEKRPVETEAPAATSEPHLPPPAPQYPSVPTPAPVTSHYELPAMPVPPHIRQTESDQAETTHPRQFVQGESSCCHVHQQRERWDVERFLRNGGRLFYGSTDPEVALIWLDTARSVLEHVGCPPDLWVRMATGAMQQGSKVWWEATHGSTFKGKPIEQIT